MEPVEVMIAREFHETYERLAVSLGYQTRPESAVPWGELHELIRRLMIAVAADLLERGIIQRGPNWT